MTHQGPPVYSAISTPNFTKSEVEPTIPASTSIQAPIPGSAINPEENDMRFMVIVKASKESEAGVMPSEQLLKDMGNYNEELVKAGVMLGGDGLHPSSKGPRV